MTSQLPRFQCLFLSCQQQKKHRQQGSCDGIKVLLIDNFKKICEIMVRQLLNLRHHHPRLFSYILTQLCPDFFLMKLKFMSLSKISLGRLFTTIGN